VLCGARLPLGGEPWIGGNGRESGRGLHGLVTGWVPRVVAKEEEEERGQGAEQQQARRSTGGGTMVSASKEMAVYCFDTLVSHYTGDVVPTPGFEEGQL
jgi:hypothetical protein